MDKAYTISEVADKLGIADKTLRRWEDAGKFSSSRTLGNQRRYDREDLQILDAIKHNIISSQSDLLTLPQAADLCGVSPSSIERWVKRGVIHPFITSGKTYFPMQRLLSKLDELRTRQEEEPPVTPPPTPLAPPQASPPTPPPTPPDLNPPSRNVSLEAPTKAFLPPRAHNSALLGNTRRVQILNAFITVMIILIYHFLFRTEGSSPLSPSLPANTPLPTSTPAPKITALTSESLTLSPITPPDPVPGTIYFDAGSQSLRLFTDTWTDLALPTDHSSSTPLSVENAVLVSGTRVINKGSSNTLVNHKSINASTPVVITFTADYSPAKKYWLEQDEGSFTLYTDFPVGKDSSFTYLILAPRPEESPSPSPTPLTF